LEKNPGCKKEKVVGIIKNGPLFQDDQTDPNFCFFSFNSSQVHLTEQE
jgi:hypothetical protein